MPRKHKNLLSTIRALGDKQELTFTQQPPEAKEGMIDPQLQHAAAKFELRHGEPDTTSDELIAPLLATSVLEERLEAQLSLDTDTLETAETLHLTEITAPVEVEASHADLEQPLSNAQAIAEPKVEPKSEASKPEEPKPEQPKPGEPEAVAVNVEHQVATAATAETEAPIRETTPQQLTSPAASLPSTANPENGGNDDTQAIAPNLKAEDLLKRPEAFVLIVCAFFISLWQAYATAWPARK